MWKPHFHLGPYTFPILKYDFHGYLIVINFVSVLALLGSETVDEYIQIPVLKHTQHNYTITTPSHPWVSIIRWPHSYGTRLPLSSKVFSNSLSIVGRCFALVFYLSTLTQDFWIHKSYTECPWSLKPTDFAGLGEREVRCDVVLCCKYFVF